MHAHKNKLRLFWSISGRRGRASARLARFQEVFFVAPGLCQPTRQVAVGSLPPAEAKDRCTRARRCW